MEWSWWPSCSSSRTLLPEGVESLGDRHPANVIEAAGEEIYPESLGDLERFSLGLTVRVAPFPTLGVAWGSGRSSGLTWKRSPGTSIPRTTLALRPSILSHRCRNEDQHGQSHRQYVPDSHVASFATGPAGEMDPVSLTMPRRNT